MKYIKHNQYQGLNLLELLIVIAIIAILATMVYPNYLKFQLETKRADAHVALVTMYNTIQNFLATSNTATLQASDLATLYTLPTTSKHGYYSINVAINSPNYTITATAVSSQQLKDTNCIYLIIDNTGAKSSKNASNVASSGCW